MTKLSRYEQEVVINFNAEEETASIYTANPVWMRKLEKLSISYPDTFILKDEAYLEGKISSRTYECPKKLIALRKPIESRKLTEEQRQAMSKRMSELNKKYRAQTLDIFFAIQLIVK